MLTSYNGQTITYDAIGNPLNYRDGISLTWQNGRELATYSQGDISVNYTYDVSGMRTGKSVTQNGTTTEYTYAQKGLKTGVFSPFFSKEKSLETRINTAFFKTFRWSE